MEDNRWDDHMRDLLGEFNPGEKPVTPGDQPDSAQVPPATESLQDQSWKRIEATLDASDQAFDESLRRKIVHYHTPYDPSTWPVFLQRFANNQFLRVKLVLLKMVEVSALVLLLITAINFGVLNQFNPTPEQQDNQPTAPSQADRKSPATELGPSQTNQSSSRTHQDIFAASESSPSKTNERRSSNGATPAITDITPGNSSAHNISEASGNVIANAKPDVVIPSNDDVAYGYDPRQTDPVTESVSGAKATAHLPVIDIAALDEPGISNEIPALTAAYDARITEPISSLESEIEFANIVSVPQPTYVKTKARKYLEFAVLAQSDYNGLRMPEDRLFTSGQQIVFPQQGILSHGFGGGFTVGLGHPVWALETGVIYSAKDFQPGRQLIVGGVFDNGSVEFEAMRMQLISVPLQYRYRFDHEGRMKMYGLIGGGLNLIVQSDIDVLIKYHFPSLSFGANPNSDPDLAETIKETRRISEHIRDGAPFSTKSFLSINGGAGIEYQLTKYKTVFLQGAVMYQIPDLKFSNNNGKHLRSVSLQAGVRTPLGK